MDLSQLAAKQKRARDWQRFIEQLVAAKNGGNSGFISGIADRTRQLISAFKTALAEAAQAGSVSPTLESKIIDLERQLEQLNEEARMVAQP